MTQPLLSLALFARDASIDATVTGSCPLANTGIRSVWNILGGCALTLLVCAWHTLHFPVPENKWQGAYSFKGLCVFGFLFAPEVMIAYASREWWAAYEKVVMFRGKGYQWSMAHSFFGQMGGFAYRDENGNLSTIDCDRFLQLCEQNKIANPHLTNTEINDKSKSDAPGKAILTVQAVWFVLKDIVRGPSNLAVTLVELDTICMIVISLLAMFIWRHKPLRPDCPHVFYSTQTTAKQDESTSNPPPQPVSDEDKKSLSNAWKSQSILPDFMTALIPSVRKPDEETGAKSGTENPVPAVNGRPEEDKFDKEFVAIVAVCITWIILGGLHLIAWNFQFPTKTEQIIWRVVSLVLVASPLPFLGLLMTIDLIPWPPSRWRNDVSAVIMVLAGIVGFSCRAILVGLTLASLRALPCSAHQVVSWTDYIPHL